MFLRKCCYEQHSQIQIQLPPERFLIPPTKWLFITNSNIINIKNINITKNTIIIIFSDILNINNIL